MLNVNIITTYEVLRRLMYRFLKTKEKETESTKEETTNLISQYT